MSDSPVFEYQRVEPGQVMTRNELGRRLTFELGVPLKYYKRILEAFDRVLMDALINGEGVKFEPCTIKAKPKMKRARIATLLPIKIKKLLKW